MRQTKRQVAPPPPTLERFLTRMEAAASVEGKTLGEWIYEALAGPFAFKGAWDRPGMVITRKNYERAATAFAARLAAALAESEAQP